MEHTPCRSWLWANNAVALWVGARSALIGTRPLKKRKGALGALLEFPVRIRASRNSCRINQEPRTFNEFSRKKVMQQSPYLHHADILPTPPCRQELICKRRIRAARLSEKRFFVVSSPRNGLRGFQWQPARLGLVSAACAASRNPIVIVSVGLQAAVACEASIWIGDPKLRR
jgi:hypothetical protein